WELGYTHVEKIEAGRTVRARCTGTVTMVRDRGMQLDVNGPPYPRHVDIVGWPPDSADNSKRLMIATEIANKMTLEIDPRLIPRI
ncbi:MAG: hypothetical protein ACYTG0_20460, partial [Planctomycetota bacterium]